MAAFLIILTLIALMERCSKEIDGY